MNNFAKLIIAVLIGLSSAATILSAPNEKLLGATIPPMNGKFFYTDMRAGGDDITYDLHTHRVDALVA